MGVNMSIGKERSDGLEVVALQQLSVLQGLIKDCRDVPTSLHLPKEVELKIDLINSAPSLSTSICHST